MILAWPILVLLLAAGCRPVQSASEPTPPPAQPAPPPSAIVNHWDPASGRGSIRVTRPDGSIAEIKLHEGFHGYTGGLVLGSQNGPAYRLVGADGSTESAIWCAQDESFVLADPERELTYGWSENMGTGADGVPLRYLGGSVLEHGPDRLILASENGAAPLHVARWMLVRTDGTLLFRVRATNVGDAPQRLSLWSGEDPWVGTYGSAEGDVGWASATLIRTEQTLAPSTRCLGIADPGGNGRPPAANAFCLSPSTTTPDRMYVANEFAHSDADIDPDDPLNGDTMTAFNVGWVDRTLRSGEALEVEYALAVAEWPEPAAAAPLPPPLSDADWAPLRTAPEPSHAGLGEVTDPLRFASERVEITILPGGDEVQVHGRYRFVNRSDRALHRRIWFPFAVDDDHPYPADIELSSGSPRRMKDGIVFAVDLKPNGELIHDIRYRQTSADGSATYIVTSARAWNTPLDRAELVVTAPAGVEIEQLSYAMTGPVTTTDGAQQWSTTIERFYPDREFAIRWR